jgi:hypothetical protein
MRSDGPNDTWITSARRDGAFALVAAFLCALTLSACASDGAPADATPQQAGEAQQAPQSGRRRRVMLYTKREQVDTPLPRGASVVVRSSGPVSIVEGDLETMLIRADVSSLTDERRAGSSISATLDAQGRMVIEPVWEGGKRENEASSFEIRLPRGAKSVEVEATGAVTLTGVRADSVVRTSNGPVTVSDHGAGVHAFTTNAQMFFERVSGVIRAETTNGIVLVREAMGPVSATTERAAIDIRMASDASGPVRAHTSMGAIALRVGPAFRGLLTMRTSDAPIVVDMKPGAASVVSRRIDETVVRFGAEGEGLESTLTTEGGTIELRVMEQ